ncbi:MAG: T9SS type A sorting domain-containing protein [Bacteroidetes bacterium]|nr:T9SS type A sorting domain-containing protein [Bacteroidota bacterium]
MHTQQPKTNHKSAKQIYLAAITLTLLLSGYSLQAGSYFFSTCQGISTVIYASGGSGNWVAFPANPGNCTILTPASDTTAVSGFPIAGQYAFIWNGNNTDTAYVTVSGRPAITITTTDAQCYGQSDGSICANVSGGNAPYTYQWTNSPPLTASCVNNTVAGTYGVTVTSGDGCTATASGTVSQPASAFIATVAHTDEICYGGTSGTITLTASGGTYPYTTAAWSDGDTGVVRTGMVAGTYTYTIADANGCQQTGSVTVTQPASPFTVAASHTNAGCNSATGTITLTETGGTTPYSAVSWSGGLTGTNPTNVAAGTYTYTVSDANSCQASGSVVVSGGGLSIADSAFGATCNGLADGRIVALAYGGTAPYTYAWSTGDTTAQITHLSAGSYGVTATDASGCSAILTDNIGQPAAVSLTVASVTDASCHAQNDGAACVAASGGTAPYTYSWVPTLTSASCITGAAAGTYTVTVADGHGCTATTALTILEPTAISASLMASNVTCADSADGIASVASVSGGTAPYTYLWTTFATTDSITDLGPGSYQIVIRDANGCALLDSVQITQPAPMVVTITVTDETSPGANDGTTSATVTGGTPPYMYIWGNGAGSNSSTNLSAGSYSLTVIDANACGITDTAIVGTCTTCVWPGDADANLLVDNNDLLPIGLGYDSTGPARAVTSIVWQGNQATDWAQSFSSYTPAVNYKYADCNGDGVIDATDTTAITQNFGLTHSKTIYRKPWRAGDPVIYPLLSKDTVANGDTLTVDIHLGDVSLTATNVYGLAYTINYDPAVLDTTKTTFTYGSSWLGSPADMISISKDLPAQGVIKTAVTRIDHTTRSGSGVIAQMRAIVTTDNIDGKDLSYYPVQIIISDVRAIDQHGSVLQVNEGADSTEVGYTPLGVHSMTADADIAIYPNPANSLLHITSVKAVAQSAEVVNTLGEVVGSYTWTGTQTEHTADLSSLASGIYYIRIHTRSGVAVRKFSIAH